jgi:methylase of polypeptide subunit release factors
VIVPLDAAPPATPLTNHVTPEFEGSLTDAENCCVPLDCTVALLGETETVTDCAVGAGIVTVAFALVFPTAAVIVTDVVEERLAGALYNPVVLIVPTLELPP